MAGRGRGRGRAAFSFSVESLGITPGEALPGPILQPPPDFPLLEFPPAPMYVDPKASHQVEFRTQFLSSLDCFRKGIVHDKDRAFCKRSSHIQPTPLEFDWTQLPGELKPTLKRRKSGPNTAVATKQSKLTDINQLLSKLEEVEQTSLTKTEPEDENEEDKDAGKGEERDEVEDELEEDSDEEMDEGTDYNQNYFDNGEDYLDEDDDDDGPVY